LKERIGDGVNAMIAWAPVRLYAIHDTALPGFGGTPSQGRPRKLSAKEGEKHQVILAARGKNTIARLHQPVKPMPTVIPRPQKPVAARQCHSDSVPGFRIHGFETELNASNISRWRPSVVCAWAKWEIPVYVANRL
jgi:hypothetical protein